MSSIVRQAVARHGDASVALGLIAAVALCGLSSVPAIVIGIVSLIAALVATASPAGALVAVVATLPWFYHPLSVGTQHVPVSELLLIAALAGAGMRVASSLVLDRPARVPTWASIRAVAQSPIVLVGIVITIVGLLLAIWPYDPAHRAESLREWRWTLAEPLALVGLLTLAARRHTRLIGVALLAGATLAALQGLGDFVTGGGVLVEGTRRIAGPYPHPNALALYLARSAAFASAWWIVDERSRRWLSPVVVVIGLATLATFSRGAILAIGVAGLLILWRAPRPLRFVGYSAGMIAVAGLVIVARDRMLDLFSGGSGSLRLAIWDSALRMIADRPFRGYGNDQFLYAYLPRYVNPIAWSERFTAHAHNLILDFWVRLGIIGVAFAVLAAIVSIASAGRFVSGDLQRGMLAGAASIGLVAVFVHGLVDNAYFAHDLAMSAWVLGWLAFARVDLTQREEAGSDARGSDRRRWVHRISPR